MNEPPLYSFCPVGGIICNTCQYRITSYPHWKIYHRNIRRHEYSSKHHSYTQTYECRLAILNEFDAAMELIATKIMTAPTLLQARSIIVQYLEKGTYPYCLECSTFNLPSTGPTHKKRNHSKHHIDQRIGYKSKMWNNNDPFVLPHDFALIRENVCSALWEKLEGKDLGSRLQFWNSNITDGYMIENINVISPSNLAIENIDDESCCVVLEPASNVISTVQNDDEAIRSPDETNQRDDCAVNDELLDEGMSEPLGNVEETSVSTHNRAELVPNVLLQKLEEMEQRLFKKNSQEQQDFNDALLNRLNDMEPNRRELDEVKLLIQGQNTIVLHRLNDIEQTLQNAELILQPSRVVARTSISSQLTFDRTIIGDDVCATQHESTVCKTNQGMNRNLTNAQICCNDDNQQTNQDQQEREKDKRFQAMELQISHLTRERDQLILERDEALLLSEDMEKELHRMSQELDYFTDIRRTNSTNHLCTNDNDCRQKRKKRKTNMRVK
jgi:hypothetical protein